MKTSKIGIVLSATYLAVAIGIWIYAQSCDGWFCGLITLYPSFPWMLFYVDLVENIPIIYFLSVVINSALIYILGLLLSLLIRKIKSSRSV